MQDKIQKNNLAVRKSQIVDLMFEFVLDTEVFSSGLNIGPLFGAIFKQNGDICKYSGGIHLAFIALCNNAAAFDCFTVI